MNTMMGGYQLTAPGDAHEFEALGQSLQQQLDTTLSICEHQRIYVFNIIQSPG